MARKKHSDPPVRWSVNLPESLAKEALALFRDPIFNRTLYDARSSVLTQLLTEAIADIKTGRRKFDPLTKRLVEVKQ